MPVLAPPAPVTNRDGSALLVAHLATVDRAVRHVCRWRRLSRIEGDELASDMYFHLLRNDGAVLQRYQGRSQLSAFLITVVDRLLLDARIARAGKWRPSATARRIGRAAVLLEQAMHRDGLRLQEASVLVAQQLGTPFTDDELDFLFSLLPNRLPRRKADASGLERLAAGSLDSEQHVLRAEVRTDAQRLARSVRRLRPEDRQILWLRYAKRVRAADIGRQLGLDPKGVYGRCERAIRRLRAEMATAAGPGVAQSPAIGTRTKIAVP